MRGVLKHRGSTIDASILGTKKFASASDKACWTHTNLRTILKQEMYYGAIVGHKRQGIGV